MFSLVPFDNSAFVFVLACLLLLLLVSGGVLILRRRRRHARRLFSQPNSSAISPPNLSAPPPMPVPMAEDLVSPGAPKPLPAFGLFLFNAVKNEQLSLKELPITLGRGEDNAICITDPTVSLRHARILYHPVAEKIYIEDLHSTNGLWINDQPTVQQILDNDDQIRLGQTTFTFKNTGYLHPVG